jgi:hypothetical protein
LPLAILPLDSPALRRARLIKNVRLQSVVELFSDADAGSGQLEVEDLIAEFEWDPTDPPDDLIMMRKLAYLPSYDVYSLRINLREQDINIDDLSSLQLSKAKNNELSEYMTDFTRPLIMQIYGDDEMDVQSFEDVIKLFRDPDVKKAIAKIQVMSQKLGINPEDIPNFMEKYGDIFLSLSYYRECLDSIEPIVTEFLDGMNDLKKNFQFKNDTNLMNTVKMIEGTINERMAAITGRFENFERGTKYMWDDISAERFHKVEKLISSYHTTIGGVLCALSVKMNAWARLFPNKDAGGPGRRAEFIMSEMKQGIENIVEVDDAGPMLAALENDV